MNEPKDAEELAAPLPLRLTLQPSGLIVEVTRGDTLVGRHSEANLRLPLADVSRRHCRLFFAGDAWQIQDLDCLNGVYVNEMRVREAMLHDGDALRIGGFCFRVDLHSNAVHQTDKPDRMIRGIAEVLASAPNRKAS